MRTRSLLAGTLLLLIAGCVVHMGSRADLTSPAGSRISLEMRDGGQMTGELLEARDTALVLLSDNVVTLVRVAGVNAVTVPAANIFFKQRPRLGGLLRDLQLEARYPQGIADPVMARLLAEWRQPALVVRD